MASTIQYSLPAEKLELLKDAARAGESPSQTAKRLLIEALESDRPPIGSEYGAIIADLSRRMKILEKWVFSEFDPTLPALVPPPPPPRPDRPAPDLVRAIGENSELIEESEERAGEIRDEKPLPYSSLKYAYAIVAVAEPHGEEGKTLVAFWNGKRFGRNPEYTRIYKIHPSPRTLEKADRLAENPRVKYDSPDSELRHEPGRATYFNCFGLLQALGYPDKWQGRIDLEELERKWFHSLDPHQRISERG